MKEKFIQPAQLKYNVCKQCRKNAYIGKEFSGWNKYAEAWWTPCITTTLFSIDSTILRSGYIHCPPKVFLDMKKEVVSLIAKNFSGDKKELLISSLTNYPQLQKRHVTDPVPDWCPNKELHKTKEKLLEIFGAIITNKEIKYATVCHNCGNEWFINEELTESTSSAGKIFVKDSITTKKVTVCSKCKCEEITTALKRVFFYG